MDPTSHNKANSHKHHQPSSSDLLSSAKYVAEAAQATFRHETDKVDKGRAAGAAADLLEAASHYGKLEEKSFGNYIEKAENYLHQYHSTHSSTTTTTDPHSGHSTTTTTTHSEHSTSTTNSGGDGHSGSGYGDYFKMAEGFMKNSNSGHSATGTGHGSGGDEQSGGGYGEYFKMAEGFFKK